MLTEGYKGEYMKYRWRTVLSRVLFWGLLICCWSGVKIYAEESGDPVTDKFIGAYYGKLNDEIIYHTILSITPENIVFETQDEVNSYDWTYDADLDAIIAEDVKMYYNDENSVILELPDGTQLYYVRKDLPKDAPIIGEWKLIVYENDDTYLKEEGLIQANISINLSVKDNGLLYLAISEDNTGWHSWGLEGDQYYVMFPKKAYPVINGDEMCIDVSNDERKQIFTFQRVATEKSSDDLLLKIRIQLANAYRLGDKSYEQDLDTALDMYRDIIEETDDTSPYYQEACYGIGEILFLHHDQECIEWYEKAAGFGYTDAMIDLGSIYELGLCNVPVDFRKAEIWYKKAAENGHPEGEQDYQRVFDKLWG